MSLDVQHRTLTDQIVDLKFHIAEQKGKHEELSLDWNKLHSEQTACQSELGDIDEECDDIRAETEEMTEEIERAKQRLAQIITDMAPDQQAVEEVRNECNAELEVLNSMKEEQDQIEAAGETLRTTIDDLKGDASRISSERATLASESLVVEREIDELREEIASIKHMMEEATGTTDKCQTEIARLRKESDTFARQNEVLESKIALREERMTHK